MHCIFTSVQTELTISFFVKKNVQIYSASVNMMNLLGVRANIIMYNNDNAQHTIILNIHRCKLQLFLVYTLYVCYTSRVRILKFIFKL